MPQVSVRPATLDDVEFLSQTAYATYVEAAPEPPAEDAAGWLDGYRTDTREQVLGLVEDSVTYVVEADGQRVGRLRVVRTPERVFIAGIQIHPDHQRRGSARWSSRTCSRRPASRACPPNCTSARTTAPPSDCTHGWGSGGMASRATTTS